MGDFCVHRLRIGDWVPCAIKSIAVDPLSSKIAIGRENGDIEICDSANKWFCQARIPGMKDFKLQALTWSPSKEQSGRLFGISLRGFVFEVDLTLLRIGNIRDTYGGTAWAMSASPRAALMAIGCEDGVIRLFRYESNSMGPPSSSENLLSYRQGGALQNKVGGGLLEYSKSLPTSGSRILCVAYHPTEKRLFAGCSDGSVRCMEEDSGRVLFRMLGDVLRGSVSTLIWSLLVLPDSTVVTGDSRGQVQVWDGSAGVLMDSFRQHTADVLALAASADGSSVFAAGVDGKVVCLQKAASSAEAARIGPSGTRSRSNSMIAAAPADNTWVYVHAHRAHSHDVLALAVCPGPASATRGSNSDAAGEKKRVSFAGLDGSADVVGQNLVLLSGGVDTRLCTYSVDHFVRTRPTWIPPIPTNSLIQRSQSGDILALRNRDYVDIWGLALQPRPNSAQSSSGGAASCDNNCRLRLRLQLKGNDHTQCAALSPAGNFLAVSSAAGLRVYELGADAKKGGLRSVEAPIVLTRIPLPEGLQLETEFAHSLAFVDVAKDGAAIAEEAPTKKRSGKTAKNADAATQKRVTMLAMHCAKQGAIVLLECQASAADAGPTLKAVQTIAHRSIVQSRTSSMERESDLALTQAISKMVFSSDGAYLAVCSASSKTIVYVYDVVRQKLHWILPTSANCVTDLSFRTTTDAEGNKGVSIVLLNASNTFRVYDVLGLKLDSWSEQNEVYFPTYVQDLNAPLCGLAIDAVSQNRVVLYGQSCCVYVDLTRPLSAEMKASLSMDASSKLLKSSLLKKRGRSEGTTAAGSSASGTPSKKKPSLRTKEDVEDEDLDGLDDPAGDEDAEGGAEADPESNFVVFNKYRNLLDVGFIEHDQLIVVENPWARVLPNLPDTLARKRYGT